ncbi:MAG: cobalamin-dependent protein [Phycisphaerales bacterium]
MSEWAVESMVEHDGSLERRYGARYRELWRAELKVLIQHLAEAIALHCPQLFLHHVCWSRAGFVARDVNPGDLRLALESLREVIATKAPKPVVDRACGLLDEAVGCVTRQEAQPGCAICNSQPNASLARMYLLHLLQRDQAAAANVIVEAQREGKSVPELYETVITPALAEVGRMWQLQEASVADEHYCTAATHMVMSQIRARMPRKPSNGKRVLATAVGGDLHDVGIRMVADLFEMNGWQAEYLGANMPTDEVVASLVDEHGEPAFDLLALSAATALSVRGVAEIIRAVREQPALSDLPIIVGGGPFCLVPELWKSVGADGHAASATTALEVAERLVRPTTSSGQF